MLGTSGGGFIRAGKGALQAREELLQRHCGGNKPYRLEKAHVSREERARAEPWRGVQQHGNKSCGP